MLDELFSKNEVQKGYITSIWDYVQNITILKI